jgi:hypothetical protein
VRCDRNRIKVIATDLSVRQRDLTVRVDHEGTVGQAAFVAFDEGSTHDVAASLRCRGSKARRNFAVDALRLGLVSVEGEVSGGPKFGEGQSDPTMVRDR